MCIRDSLQTVLILSAVWHQAVTWKVFRLYRGNHIVYIEHSTCNASHEYWQFHEVFTNPCNKLHVRRVRFIHISLLLYNFICGSLSTAFSVHIDFYFLSKALKAIVLLIGLCDNVAFDAVNKKKEGDYPILKYCFSNERFFLRLQIHYRNIHVKGSLS